MCLVLSVTLVVATVCAADRLALVMMRCCARATVANAPDHKYNIYAKHFRVIHTHTTTHTTPAHIITMYYAITIFMKHQRRAHARYRTKDIDKDIDFYASYFVAYYIKFLTSMPHRKGHDGQDKYVYEYYKYILCVFAAQYNFIRMNANVFIGKTHFFFLSSCILCS